MGGFIGEAGPEGAEYMREGCRGGDDGTSMPGSITDVP
jgi:hypothetical protein